MAIFKVTPDQSVLKGTGQGPAFDADTPAADSLILDPGAFLIATDNIGVSLANTGPWTVTINGVVFGAPFGIAVSTANITVGAEGDVFGTERAILVGSNMTLKNAGEIEGRDYGIYWNTPGARTITDSGTIGGGINSIVDDGASISNDKVTNTGLLQGEIDLGLGQNSLTNSGKILGDFFSGDGNDTLTNTGTLDGEVQTGDGNDSVSNTKLLTGSVDLGGGNDKFTSSGQFSVLLAGSGNDVATNSGTLSGGADLGSGDDQFTNSGQIGSLVDGGIGNDKITNSGTIDDELDAGDGNDTVTNSKLINDKVTLGIGDDKLTNTGTLANGVDAGDGNDTIVSTGHAEFGVFSLGSGDDKFTGGNFNEIVRDGPGNDTVNLGGGIDIFNAELSQASDGLDVVDGGSGGNDRYDVFFHTADLRINLDTKAHDNSPFSADGAVAANTAVGDKGTDIIKNFEDVLGGAGNDFIYGSAAANVVFGGNGIDSIYGFGGNDVLNGGTGADGLVGGAGRDTLSGEDGADFFVLLATSDSGITKATRDVIQDFVDGSDRIHLSFIDANTKNGAAVNDGFTYINGNSSTTIAAVFTGIAGELRSYWTGSGQMIEGDVNGDKKADFSIELVDPTHAITLTNTDFVL